jgi:hypothetical protein
MDDDEVAVTLWSVSTIPAHGDLFQKLAVPRLVYNTKGPLPPSQTLLHPTFAFRAVVGYA